MEIAESLKEKGRSESNPACQIFQNLIFTIRFKGDSSISKLLYLLAL